MALPDTRYSLLVRLAQRDDRAAWSDFIEHYEDAIYRYSRSRGLQEADAREVVQEVLLAVHSVAAKWEPSGRTGSFRAWLLQTASRTCFQMLRQRTRHDCAIGGSSVHRQLHDVATQDSDNEADALELQRLAFCWAAAHVEREVQPGTWRAFWLTAVDGEAAPRVAMLLGMSVGSVYAAKCRVLARIRQRIQEFARRDS